MTRIIALALLLMLAPAAQARTLAVVKLRPTTADPGAHGRFTLLASRNTPRFTIRAAGLPPSRLGKAYGVWLAGPRPHFLGFAPTVGENGRLGVSGPRPSDRGRLSRWLNHARYVLLTLESDEHLKRPETTVLSGRVRHPLVRRFDPGRAVGCFARASRDGNVTVPGPSRHPKRVCRRLWRRGVVRRGVHDAPRLVVCVHQPEGTAWVLPGGPAACARVGLPVARN